MKEKREEALRAYSSLKKDLIGIYHRLVGAQSNVLDSIGTVLFMLAVAPPFIALLYLVSGENYTYTLPDGTLLHSSESVILTLGNMTIHSVASDIPMSKIVHGLTVSGIVSGVLVAVAFLLWFINMYVQKKVKDEFVEDYIKDKKEVDKEKSSNI